MTTVVRKRGRGEVPVRELPPALARRFEAVVFDWDGTAVPDRTADASELRGLVEELSTAGLDLVVITGTHVGNVDGQLQARPRGPGRLLFCVNRGSEVFEASADGVRLLERREATAAENAALDAAAVLTVESLAAHGVEAEIVSQRLNRRKVDLIPLPEWHDPPKARIAELLEAVEERLHGHGLAGLRDAVGIALDAARTAGLPGARVTSDAKHLEIGLTDKADSARWTFADLMRRGITPRLVLVAGDEFGALGGLPGSDSFLLVPEGSAATAVSVGAEPTGTPAGVVALHGGPDAFAEILCDQLERRRRGELPELDGDPAWTLTIEGLAPRLQRVHETLLAVGDGKIGTRGVPTAHEPGAPVVAGAGIYVGTGAETELAPCPDWTRVHLEGAHQPVELRRSLDLRAGIFAETGDHVAAVRFSSLAAPGTVALRVDAEPGRLPQGTTKRTGRALKASWRDRRRGRVLERIGAYARDAAVAETGRERAAEAGFEGLLRGHREAWATRWAEADVVLEGDAELQRAIRFALFHLMASVADHGEAAVGARGLSGTAYRGHVFWDSDVFVLPFLAATHPGAARAMLEYRIRRLDAARANARQLGRRGARWPWESAADGVDVTPTSARLPTGELAPIRTGELEEHIVADVAWAAAAYIDWTGDTAFAAAHGRELITESARYWPSRARFDRAGRAHIYGVIGPDEYHEPVDDNAFTNVMARWNLRRAAALAPEDPARDEWLALADALVDGYDRASGIYEQFAGFFELEPLIIEEIAPRRPIAADLLLGAERAAGAQVIKQADVLMLHHLVPDQVARGSLVPNVDVYEPRTAHGSSLSPAISASVLARAGRYRAATEALRIAARLDLDDLTGTTAGGVHLATMGGLWQALVFGFAGIRPHDDRVSVDPRLPPEWHALEVGLRFHDRPLRLRIDRDGVSTASPSWDIRQTETQWEVVPR